MDELETLTMSTKELIGFSPEFADTSNKADNLRGGRRATP